MSEPVTLTRKLQDCFAEAASKHPDWQEAIDRLVAFSVNAEGGPAICVDMDKVRKSDADPEFKDMLEKADRIIKEHKGPLR